MADGADKQCRVVLAQTTGTDPLSKLEFETGWVALGVLDASSQEWATLYTGAIPI